MERLSYPCFRTDKKSLNFNLSNSCRAFSVSERILKANSVVFSSILMLKK